MSCPNFRPMLYGMPLVCACLEDFNDMAAEYEKETGEEFDQFLYEMEMQEEADEAKRLAEDFTENLRFHDVTVISGYYNGVQFFVEEKNSAVFDLDKDSKYCIDNEDAHYYYGECRSKVIRAADAEKRKIRRWLENLKSNGYEILAVTARFSNGETLYGRA